MAHDQGVRAIIRRIRRGARQQLNHLLVQFGGTPEPHSRPLEPPPRRILVVRLNKRLGNAMFITPLLRSLAATFPDADIDILMRGRANAVLLRGLPGVRATHVLESGLGSALGMIRAVRRQRFDLAVIPSRGSSSDRYGALLCGADRRLGFAGPDQWLRLSHAAAPDAEHHPGRSPLALLRNGLGETPVKLHHYLSVQPDADARAAAAAARRAALGANHGPVLAFFTRATGNKQLPTDWWQAWLNALRQSGDTPQLLEIKPGPDAAALAPDMPGVHLAALDQLAALIADAELFVAGDCGPMHLAAATGTPTVGLFRASSPAHYAPLGPHCVSLSDDDIEPARAAECTLALWRQTARLEPASESAP